VLALRLVAALNAVGDAAISELLHGRTALSQFCLLAAVLPGWLAVYHYRKPLLQDLYPPRPSDQRQGGSQEPGAAPAGESTLVARIQAAAVFTRNARRMPRAFWLATSVSAAVALQVAKEVSSRAIRGVLRTRLRLLLGLALVYGFAKGGGKERAVEALAHISDTLSPAAETALATAWYQLQVASRLACRELLAKLQAGFARLEMLRPPTTGAPSRPGAAHTTAVGSIEGPPEEEAAVLPAPDSSPGPVFRGRPAVVVQDAQASAPSQALPGSPVRPNGPC